MPNHLMLVAWPTGLGNQIATSFRYTPYVFPVCVSISVADNRLDLMTHLSLTEELPS